MPLYEYECDACGHRFEVIQKFSDPLVDTCPTCGGVVHKLMSSPAIQFKGSGWYITDYAKKDTSSAGKAGESKEQDGPKDKDSSSSEKSERSEKKDSEKKESAAKSDTSSASTTSASDPTSKPTIAPTTSARTKSDG